MKTVVEMAEIRKLKRGPLWADVSRESSFADCATHATTQAWGTRKKRTGVMPRRNDRGARGDQALMIGFIINHR